MKTLVVLLWLVATASAYKIAIVPKMTSADAFYGLTHEGCKDRVKSISMDNNNNVTCYYIGTHDASVEGSLEILNELIDDDTVDGITISVLDPEAYTPVINRGIAQGKPIITFDSDAPDSNRLAYVGTDNYALGRELAKLLKQVKPDGGTYGIVSGFGVNLADRVQGVRDVLDDSLWVEVSESPKNGYEDSDKSLARMWDLVQENKDIGAIVSVVGLVRRVYCWSALQSCFFEVYFLISHILLFVPFQPMFKENTTDWKNFVDSNRDVLTVIADTLPIQLELMQINYVDALVGQLPYTMGMQSADTLLHVIEATKRGTPLDQALPSDIIFGTHQLEVLRIPLQLPPLDFNYNYIGQVAIVGYILCAIIMAVSLGFMGWTWWYRKNVVVTSSQPVFLYMICLGTLLMVRSSSVVDPSILSFSL